MEDQPAPKPNDFPAIADLVMADLAQRKRLGIERYGTPLQPFNGRKGLVDAYQEALDLAIYLRQEMEERRELEAAIERLTQLLTMRNGDVTRNDLGVTRKLTITSENPGEDAKKICDELAKEEKRLKLTKRLFPEIPENAWKDGKRPSDGGRIDLPEVNYKPIDAPRKCVLTPMDAFDNRIEISISRYKCEERHNDGTPAFVLIEGSILRQEIEKIQQACKTGGSVKIVDTSISPSVMPDFGSRKISIVDHTNFSVLSQDSAAYLVKLRLRISPKEEPKKDWDEFLESRGVKRLIHNQEEVEVSFRPISPDAPSSIEIPLPEEKAQELLKLLDSLEPEGVSAPVMTLDELLSLPVEVAAEYLDSNHLTLKLHEPKEEPKKDLRDVVRRAFEYVDEEGRE